MTTMTKEESVTTPEQWAEAGAIAAAWFERAEPLLKAARTKEQRELENELLDGALMDAGIIPQELPAFTPSSEH